MNVVCCLCNKKCIGKPDGLLCTMAGTGITPDTWRSDRHTVCVEKESESVIIIMYLRRNINMQRQALLSFSERVRRLEVHIVAVLPLQDYLSGPVLAFPVLIGFHQLRNELRRVDEEYPGDYAVLK